MPPASTLDAVRPLRATAAAHVFSADVEEHFQVQAFERLVPRETWDRQPSRVERNTHLLLDLLARHGATGTFFTVGWVAARSPGLVRAIADAGHEVACHGWWHRRVYDLGPRGFRDDLRRAKGELEAAGGQPVVGFRAPSFSIVPGCEWALEILVEEGFRYDSSLFPVRRRGYGYPSAPTTPAVLRLAAGELVTLPPLTHPWRGQRLPAAGGGWLRQLPFAFFLAAFRAAAERGESAMFYVHPWEVDPEQPRVAAPWLTRVRHYRGLARTMPAMERLLAEFPFRAVRDVFPSLHPSAVS